MAGRIAVLCVTAHSDRPEAETLIGLKAEDIDVHVMCSPQGREYPRLLAAGVVVTPFDIQRRLDFAAIAAIRSELRRHDYDILHLFNNKAVLHGLLAARGSRVKVVVYRGIVGNVSFLSPFSWLRYLNPRVDRIVCVAEAVRTSFLSLRFFGLRVPPAKLVTIYKGHDLSWYRDPPVERSELGVPASAFAVCCVANWRPRKGIEVLVEAFRRLPAEAPIHLILVGDMRDRNLRRSIETHPRRDRIRLLGTRTDAPSVVAACDVAVLPALKREGLAKTVIEAMAYGIPPIVTDVGGNPELVENGVSGIVVRPSDPTALADAILRLDRDRRLAHELGERARLRIAERFSIRTTIERTAGLYRELVRRP